VSATAFNWVRKRDGRLVPFEPDKISRALFAALEHLGRPEPFLARELTDSILHFLNADRSGPILTSEQIGELVVKVVRELGQPALARAFEEGSRARLTATPRGEPAGALQARSGPDKPNTGPDRPADTTQVRAGSDELQQVAAWAQETTSTSELAWRIASPILRDYSLQAIFSRDLQAAHRDGLLVLGGLDAPLEMAGCVLRPASPGTADVLSALEQARSLAGGWVAVDGPDHLLARSAETAEAAGNFIAVFQSGLSAARLWGILNLNSASPPPGSEALVLGPLFEDRSQGLAGPRFGQLSEALLESVLSVAGDRSRIRIDWHLGAGDFQPAALPFLQRLVRRVQDGIPVTFVFDRPRRAIALAEGLDRRHPAVLLEVGVCLPRLLDQHSPALDGAELVHKVGSLARMALSAGTQKRDFLRRHSAGRPFLSTGFLLDRARLKVVPLGLEPAVRRVLGAPAGQDEAALDLARQVVARLERVLQEDGECRLLDTCVGSAFPSADFAEMDRLAPGPEAILYISATADSLSSQRIIEVLRDAWQRTEVARVCWVASRQSDRQLLASWEKKQQTEASENLSHPADL
jgi:ATP cone domain